MDVGHFCDFCHTRDATLVTPQCRVACLVLLARREDVRGKRDPEAPRLLRGLSSASKQEVLRGATTFTFAAGEELPHGEPGVAMTGLIGTGLVRTFLQADDGEREQTIRYLGTGDLLGGPQLFGRPVPHAQCVTEVRITRLVPETLRELMQTDCDVAIAVAKEIIDDYSAAMDELAVTSFRSVRERVAHQLLLRARVEGPILDVTQRDLARTVGSVREVVGRAMQDFERLGAVRRRENGHLELDLDALQEIRTAPRRG